jgi:hypothetical protein
MCLEPKGTGAIEYLPELRRIHLPRTRSNKGKEKAEVLTSAPAAAHLASYELPIAIDL